MDWLSKLDLNKPSFYVHIKILMIFLPEMKMTYLNIYKYDDADVISSTKGRSNRMILLVSIQKLLIINSHNIHTDIALILNSSICIESGITMRMWHISGSRLSCQTRFATKASFSLEKPVANYKRNCLYTTVCIIQFQITFEFLILG